MPEITIEKLLHLAPKAFLPDKAAGIEAVIQLNLTGVDGGDWVMTIEDQTLTLKPGIHTNPRLRLSADSKDVLAIANGRMDPMQAFMLGKLKLSGDTALAMKLINLFSLDPNLLND